MGTPELLESSRCNFIPLRPTLSGFSGSSAIQQAKLDDTMPESVSAQVHCVLPSPSFSHAAHSCWLPSTWAGLSPANPACLHPSGANLPFMSHQSPFTVLQGPCSSCLTSVPHCLLPFRSACAPIPAGDLVVYTLTSL